MPTVLNVPNHPTGINDVLTQSESVGGGNQADINYGQTQPLNPSIAVQPNAVSTNNNNNAYSSSTFQNNLNDFGSTFGSNLNNLASFNGHATSLNAQTTSLNAQTTNLNAQTTNLNGNSNNGKFSSLHLARSMQLDLMLSFLFSRNSNLRYGQSIWYRFKCI